MMLFFNSHHDANNTMASELKAIDDFREKVQMNCVCIDYKNSPDFGLRLADYLDTVVSTEENNRNKIQH